MVLTSIVFVGMDTTGPDPDKDEVYEVVLLQGILDAGELRLGEQIAVNIMPRPMPADVMATFRAHGHSHPHLVWDGDECREKGWRMVADWLAVPGRDMFVGPDADRVVQFMRANCAAYEIPLPCVTIAKITWFPTDLPWPSFGSRWTPPQVIVIGSNAHTGGAANTARCAAEQSFYSARDAFARVSKAGPRPVSVDPHLNTTQH